MRREAIAAIAFAGGIALALIFLAPQAETVTAEGIDAPIAPLGPLSQREAQAGVDAPRWEVGDAWRVSFAGNDPVCWMVVATDDDGIHHQGVTCGDGSEDDLVAANIAALSEGWIGEFTEDIEGVHEDETVRFFDWPLTDGKSWTTEWFGSTMTVTARYAQVEGPSGPEPGYRLVMVDDEGEPIAEYDYAPSIQWWSRLEFPRTGYVFGVVQHERGWQTPVVYGIAQARYEDQNVLVPDAQRFVVPEEDDILVVRAIRPASVLGTPSAGYLALTDPNGNPAVLDMGVRDNGVIGGSSYRGFAIEYLPAVEGTWTVSRSHAGTGVSSLLVSGVALERVELG